MSQFTDRIEAVLAEQKVGAHHGAIALAIEKALGVREETVWGIWNEPNQAFLEAYQGQEWAARHDAKATGSRVGHRTETHIPNIHSQWQAEEPDVQL